MKLSKYWESKKMCVYIAIVINDKKNKKKINSFDRDYKKMNEKKEKVNCWFICHIRRGKKTGLKKNTYLFSINQPRYMGCRTCFRCCAISYQFFTNNKLTFKKLYFWWTRLWNWNWQISFSFSLSQIYNVL